MIKPFIDSDFISHYAVSPSTLVADEYNTSNHKFDLKDNDSGNPIVYVKTGAVTIKQNYGRIDVLNYDYFYKQIVSPRRFAEGVHHCDYVITSEYQDVVCLVEITSSIGTLENLREPILSNNGVEVEFIGGKFEKAEVQLTDSLRTLSDVPSIAADFKRRNRRVCLMAYVIHPFPQEQLRKRPMLRYLTIEARKTADHGALIESPEINRMGFEFRRIEHSYEFNL